MSRSTKSRSNSRDVEEGLSLLHNDEPNKVKEPNYGNNIEKNKLGWETFKRLMALAKPETKLLIWGTISLFLANGALLAIPYIVGQIIDSTTKATEEGGDIAAAKKNLLHTVLLLTVIIGASSLFATIRAYFFTVAGERVVARLRKKLFSSIIVQEIAFFDENKTGELVNRLSSDCTVLQNTVTVNISMALRYVVTFISSLFMLFYISWRLTMVSLSLVPMILIASVMYGKFIKQISKEFQDALASATDTATEAISNIRTVRSFAKEEFEMKIYDDKISTTFQLAKRRSFAFGLFTGAIAFLANITVSGILYYGGYLVITGDLTAGKLTSFIIYTLTVATSLGGITALYGDIMKAIGSSERVFELLDRHPQVNWKGGDRPTGIRGELRMKNVQFSYPSRPDVTVLDDVNLDLQPGKVVALVGPSGQGKSTIASLLELFYYPTKGTILLDEYDTRSIDPQYLRSIIGLVSQEPTLFATTIAKNIAYGLDHIPMSKIIEAATLANAHSFISQFPDGYETVVGERGIKLSGGQKQRIAIARALLTDPLILLLDEATSALDSESEYLVKQALDVLMKGRTVLVIAHRLSTVKNASCVCVVEGGRIVEKGTHEELLVDPNGLYQKLVKRQLQNQ